MKNTRKNKKRKMDGRKKDMNWPYGAKSGITRQRILYLVAVNRETMTVVVINK